MARREINIELRADGSKAVGEFGKVGKASRDLIVNVKKIGNAFGEIENVRFFDLNSGDEISGVYYNMSGGYYCPSWTGDIRFSDGTTVTIPPAEPLVFGDMATANEDKVLYATNDMPVRSMFVNVTTNFQLQTWWDFSHDDWGSSPKAKIDTQMISLERRLCQPRGGAYFTPHHFRSTAAAGLP
ncbi:MAG: hypothetical protein J6T01_03180 [Kiritimatiellae bacterium]|nr:hypothetical protein [Kiritimatiellia bacterium]